MGSLGTDSGALKKQWKACGVRFRTLPHELAREQTLKLVAASTARRQPFVAPFARTRLARICLGRTGAKFEFFGTAYADSRFGMEFGLI